MLEVKQVSKLYENDRGVHNIDFSMQRGEIVGFLGPNGAGKTTTMRMITGYLNPTHGQILVDGHSMADNPKKARRKIGYLPETPPLYPEMTVQSYLRFIANLRDVPAREQKLRVGEAIDKLGLQGREKQIIRSLSKGYKQRLGLAQAILHQPDLLILDEPTSGLDPKQIIEIRQLIHELGENHTVLLSTHILPEINAICNRVLIINQGRVVLDERPENLGRTMGETFEVSLEVKGPRERILTELRSLETVASVKELDASAGIPAVEAAAEAEADTATELPEAESVKLLVTSADRSDIREDLFFRLAGAGYPILEMKRESLSLEDIFLKLTTDEPAEEGGKSEEEVDTDA
ncbi:ABC transporter ATP-binding protein [Paenibacillus aceris]|uniref:ABC-2 type transport system ATP-binding protein n=1 Tax=Paenibacillus aceris TaxID=869555 RepID=A0ABS4I4L0_9BACL|nr:ATP-binding cassette domain-containing protein [Paenibacillus aceris]MBP1965853.1 ABC-2 type transport system ATP-binding protein [Paenibacillus aceris]NHW34802.1 ATP-binding cassette domain-containing protein [Paenibacillus aceris]